MENIGLQAFLGADEESFKRASTILLQIFNNLLRTQHQNNSKFRRINITSTSFIDNVLDVPGALDLLFEVGFEEDATSSEHLYFPPMKPMTEVLVTQRAIQQTLLNSALKGNVSGAIPLSNTALHASSPVDSTNATVSKTCATTPLLDPERNQHQQLFQAQMLSFTRQVLRYENTALQAEIRCRIPVERLNSEAEKLASNNVEPTDRATEQRSAAVKNCLLYLLLKWFKEEFFRWVNNLKCVACDSESDPLPVTESTRHLFHPTAEESRYEASRVEIFRCRGCQAILRFPRYNDVRKLLDTRSGRCGEWANCFTACCRALGFDARYVQDNADHVWTEVYSDLDERWLHADSCETALDQPLIYESGWGKKLSYVLAFSKDEVVDVTWRYSANFSDLQERRNRVSEAWLRSRMAQLSNRLQLRLSLNDKSIIRQRRFREAVEFLTPRTVKDSEMAGRTSGSLTWRLARGESGTGRGDSHPHFIIVPSEQEILEKKLTVRYDPVTDVYERGSQRTTGFASVTFETKNIARKVESDWRMVYIARTPGSDTGKVAWKIDCSGTKVRIGRISVKIPRTKFHSGVVDVTLTVDGESSTARSIPIEFETYSTDLGSVAITSAVLSAELTGGSGGEAWQHAQLFRESLDHDVDLRNAFGIELDLIST